MKEIRDIIAEFERRRGEPLALATLVRARGSSYRRPGARMLIAADAHTVGTLSGGCLEEEVARHAQDVIASGQPLFLSFDTRLRYGCHGSIAIFIERASSELFDNLAAAQCERREFRVATVFEETESLGTRIAISPNEEFNGAFVQTIPPPMQLVIIGEGPDSAALRAFATILGWNVIETEEAASLPNEFDQWTAAVIKTHNYGRDYAALEKLLPHGLRYVALLGPRRRRDQLLFALTEAAIPMRSRLFAPAGLDLGAEEPEEIALAIVAEIQATFAQAASQSLRERRRPIHGEADVALA